MDKLAHQRVPRETYLLQHHRMTESGVGVYWCVLLALGVDRRLDDDHTLRYLHVTIKNTTTVITKSTTPDIHNNKTRSQRYFVHCTVTWKRQHHPRKVSAWGVRQEGKYTGKQKMYSPFDDDENKDKDEYKTNHYLQHTSSNQQQSSKHASSKYSSRP